MQWRSYARNKWLSTVIKHSYVSITETELRIVRLAAHRNQGLPPGELIYNAAL